jgi:energy-coupling factor transport system substrate-specific component
MTEVSAKTTRRGAKGKALPLERSAIMTEVSARANPPRCFWGYLEAGLLAAVPLSLALCVFLDASLVALATLVFVLLALFVMFARFEASRPALRQIVATAVFAALAAAGRVLFFAFSDVKPVSAICIVAGALFGRRVGFMVGALAALVSNFFFGQGPWTPWQMYAWGMIGYCAGVLADQGFFERRAGLYVYGFLSAMGFGLLLNLWYFVGFVEPLTWPGALLALGAGLPHDLAHGASTVAFLLVIYAPWQKKIERIKRKFDLAGL